MSKPELWKLVKDHQNHGLKWATPKAEMISFLEFKESDKQIDTEPIKEDINDDLIDHDIDTFTEVIIKSEYVDDETDHQLIGKKTKAAIKK